MASIGKKLREFRLAKDWTLAELSKHSGVALSTLSRIETGRMTGTLESHVKVGRALGVRLAELYAELEPAGALVEHRPAASLSKASVSSASGAQLTVLTTGSMRKKMLPAMLHLPPGKSTKPEHTAGVERLLYLLKGRCEVTVGKERIHMDPGDSLYFQAALPHFIRNVGSGTLLALSVTAPPSL